MISVSDGLDPLLKRPFSIHRMTGQHIQFLYRVTGRGTSLLCGRKKGDVLDVLGPLGNSFPNPLTHDRPVLVAGGVGIAPIFALAESIKKKRPLLFYGARSRKDILCLEELKALGIEPVITTDDGTLGEKGYITEALEKFLGSDPSLGKRCRVYACGPGPMLAALASLAQRSRLSGYVALEQRMACGLGTCLGCVVNTTEGYKRVCKEGPVFRINEIKWGDLL